MIQIRAFLLPIAVVFGFLLGVPAIAQVAVDAAPKVEIVPVAPVIDGGVKISLPAPLAAPASAEAAAPAPASGFVWGPLVSQVVQLLSPILMALLAWLFALTRKLILAHVKNVTASGILARLDSYVEARVRALAQTYVNAAKTSGTWNAETAKAANASAVAAIKSDLGSNGLADLSGILGVGNVETFLSSKVEAQVHALAEPAPAPAAK